MLFNMIEAHLEPFFKKKLEVLSEISQGLLGYFNSIRWYDAFIRQKLRAFLLSVEQDANKLLC